MITDSNKKIINDINPDLIKLTDISFKSKNVQYNTNYFIFLEEKLVKNQTHLYTQNKKECDEFLITNKQKILNNFNIVLKNYQKK
jgi:hypothetical protein